MTNCLQSYGHDEQNDRRNFGKRKRLEADPAAIKNTFCCVYSLVSRVSDEPSKFIRKWIPLFGNFVYGITAALVVLLLDIIDSVTFLFVLWTRKSWAAKWAFAYIGIFILNSMVALFTEREELGLPQLLVPTIASLIFLAVIFWKRNYFNPTPGL